LESDFVCKKTGGARRACCDVPKKGFCQVAKNYDLPFLISLSMDWFKGKSKPETIDFPTQIMGLSFPIFP
jgi:hypothetical protein